MVEERQIRLDNEIECFHEISGNVGQEKLAVP